MTEPVTLTIEPGTESRMARIHDALRDLDLELCSRCHVWRGVAHFTPASANDDWRRPVCMPCAAAASIAQPSLGRAE